MDLIPHLQLGGQNLLGCLCPERDYLPYWHMSVDGDFTAEYQFRPHCTGHNVGRWWNALLRLEAAIGFELPPAVEAAMLENTWRLADNPSGILLEDPDPDRPHTWYIHSYRETMLALGLLVEHRASRRAREQGLRAVEGMSRASVDLHRWSFSPGADLPPVEPTGRGADPVYTHGRAIEGLLCFHRATGDSRALEEVERLADFHHRYTIAADGELAPGCGHHTHSYLNTVRGLVELAAGRGHEDRLEALLATYRRAISPMITPSGFITHDIGARHGGDIASAGDIAHIALLLWDYCRDPSLLDDAERIVRARLITAQVMAPLALEPRQDRDCDRYRDLPRRFVGAIGGSVGHVKGQTCVTDFTAAVLHSLVALYDRSIDVEEDCVRVNFHFDRTRDDVRVRARRRDGLGSLMVDSHTGLDLELRLPGWVDAAAARMRVDGQSAPVRLHRGFVHVAATGPRTRVEMEYPLPERQVRESWRDEWAHQEEATFTWRGDQIVGVEPGGPYMPPYAKECPSIG